MNKLLPLLLLPALASAQITVETLPSIEETTLGSALEVPTFDFDTERSAHSDLGTGAILRGLDRITGAVNNFGMFVGETLEFERLEITLEACRYPVGDINADAFALLKIRDIRNEEPSFYGWMFASSPALSALDHPRYDVWVLTCESESASSE
ncbi:MAG: DUF2155 domain-containing protein [Rhodobacteraceae bacterium]|nr:DUF2155 domain-containing protein [Paracoccaceae bacterium]